MGGDLVIGPALAEASENAPAPQHPPVRGEPARERRRPFVNHACLAWPPAWRPLLTERSTIAWRWKVRKRNLRIFAVGGPAGGVSGGRCAGPIYSNRAALGRLVPPLRLDAYRNVVARISLEAGYGSARASVKLATGQVKDRFDRTKQIGLHEHVIELLLQRLHPGGHLRIQLAVHLAIFGAAFDPA